MKRTNLDYKKDLQNIENIKMLPGYEEFAPKYNPNRKK